MKTVTYAVLLAGASFLACGQALGQQTIQSPQNPATPPSSDAAEQQAQTPSATPPVQPADAASVPADDTSQPGTAADVVVTGSRTITNGNNSPTPVSVLTTAELQATRPTTVFEGLTDIPAFAGSRGGAGANPTGNGANSGQISALNLRGLGPVRTLVLYDGHRVPPTELDGFVNANVIPQLLLQRVDVVTGGASAVYGSDAIGGVVNFITDRKFKGLKLEAQGGISGQGDDAASKVGAAFGTDLFGGRGHYEASLQYIHSDGILYRRGRSQYVPNWTVQGNGCPNGVGSAGCVPYYLTAGAVNPAYSYGGKIINPATNPFRNYTFNSDGTLRPFVNGPTVGSVQIGGDGIYDTRASLLPRDDLYQGYGRFDFDVTDHVHFYVTASATLDHTFNNFGDVNSQSTGNVLSACNPFLAPAYQAAMGCTNTSYLATGQPTFNFMKKYANGSLVPPTNVDFYTRAIYINTGVEGTISKFKYDLSYTHSDVRLDARSNYTFNNGRFFAALDAVRDPSSGAIVCRTTLTNPGLYPGCVPINVFGTGSETQAMVDYVGQKGRFLTYLPNNDVTGSISGSPFDTWAGPLTVALTGEWHRQELRVTTTSPTLDYAPLDCTGIRFNCTAKSATSQGTPLYNGGVAPRPTVDQNVVEGAIEADVPLLKDFVLAQSLNVNAAYRYAHYIAHGNPDITAAPLRTTFGASTWKVGVDWHVVEGFTLRATRSQDIRAPNLYELYQSNATTFTNGNFDYLTNSSTTGTGALPQSVTGGNANLRPEVAHTTTAGLVLKPVPQVSIAVDYFDIKIDNFITTLNGATQAFQQACYAGNAFYCSLQVRPGPLTDTSKANAITRYYVIPVNVAQLSTKGIDFELNYRTQIAARPFSIRGLLTYQPHVFFVQPGANRQDFAGAIGTPVAYTAGARIRGAAFIHFNPTERLGIDWLTRFRGPLHQSPDPTLLVDPSANVPAVAFHSLTISQQLGAPFGGKASVYLNIENILDQAAPIGASLTTQASPGLAGGFIPGDDPVGRYFNLGVRIRW